MTHVHLCIDGWLAVWMDCCMDGWVYHVYMHSGYVCLACGDMHVVLFLARILTYICMKSGVCA